MSTAAATRRGRPPARHDDDALLTLTAQVAEEAERRRVVPVAARVSQRDFNALCADVDRGRGVDPDGPDRTPTANAIVMHFRARAAAPLKWADVVAAALGSPTERRQWLVVTRRSEPAAWLTGAHIAFALRRVATELAVETVTPQQYEAVSTRLRDEDRAANGEDAVLADLLPTVHRVRTFCDGDWNRALTFAALHVPDASAAAAARRRRPPAAGLPVHVALAYYAAINGVWASYPTLLAFSRAAGFAMANPPAGGTKPLVRAARQVLQDAGIQPPPGDAPKPLGRGRRLRFRFPANGIPGAPRRNDDSGPEPDARRQLKDELAVLSVRVWLAGLGDGAKAGRAQYVAWDGLNDGWMHASKFPFSAVKRLALDANRRDRRLHGTDVPRAARDRAAELKRLLHIEPSAGPPASFADTVAAVLAGALDEVEAPKQS